MPLNECPDFGPERPFNLDDPNPLCGKDCTTDPSLKDVPQPSSISFEDLINNKKGFGTDGNCDPVQSGNIINDLSKDPNRNLIFRYSRSIRGCDEAVTDMFHNIIVIDEQGSAHPVPILWSTQERAVMAVMQENVRKDPSLVVDRVKLPLMSIYSNNFTYNPTRYTYHQVVRYPHNKKVSDLLEEKPGSYAMFGSSRGIPIDIGYTLTIWTYFIEDMNQILEQILLKFSSIAYIRIQGVQWETILKLDSIASNLDTEPGNTANRVIKFQINMTAETYISQPIVRNKPVLKTRIDIANSLSDDEITQIIARLEDSIKELDK